MSTWMVVEDEPDIYELLLAMFEIWGIEGVAFVDGEEATAWIDETDKGMPSEIPELAVLDIRLPGNVSGPMVGERIRKSPVLNGMAIVLITAYKLTKDEADAVSEQAGADRIIYKPLPKFNELKTMLETAINERKAKTAAEASKAEALKAEAVKAAPAQAAQPTKTEPAQPQEKQKEN
ncbi:MAG: response regulator [Anaerolineae bacterium]|nr:response regulator [Anaerolineae bacterium]